MYRVQMKADPSMQALTDLLRNDAGRLHLFLGRRIWRRLPSGLRRFPLVHWYGIHLHALVQRLEERRQNHSTFFFRNRPELELMRRLVDRASHGSSLAISVLACSKGAEVYSIAWTIRVARPDLKLTIHAVDISQDMLEFAREGIYSLRSLEGDSPEEDRFISKTHRDQIGSIFERITEHEMTAMFDRRGDLLKVKPWLREGIFWHCGNAEDPDLVGALGPQDVVVANRFLCHMEPPAAERCLGSIAHLVKPGGYLFVSGVDLDVRTKVARNMRWKPVTDLLREIHEGDVSLRNSWPLGYWAMEPFQVKRRDRMIRYAAAFRLAVAAFVGIGLT
jgi:chemotaxis methyl-accepting protein methylase